MRNCITIFRQILQLLPIYELKKAVAKHGSDRYVKRYQTFQLLVTLLYAQITGKNSLRDIVTGLSVHEAKLYHLGFSGVTRSNLAHALLRRDYRVLEELFYALLSRCRGRARTKKFRFNNPIYALDSTAIDLCLSVFPWAKYRARKGGIKLHFKYDLRDDLPVFMVLTDGKKNDVALARELDLGLSSDSILVVDRGYTDFEWLKGLDLRGVTFVTRAKKNLRYRLIGQHSLSDRKNILADEVIELEVEKSRSRYPGRLRMVTFYDRHNDKVMRFLTNNFSFAASTVADIYKARWGIESFFRWIKQNLKIKTFYGTSKNAVLLQIWAAMIYYLLLHFIRHQTKCAWSLLELSRRIRATLMDNLSLLDLLSKNFTSNKNAHSYAAQLNLF